MKIFFSYILYGFYQIDYCFGPRYNELYNIRTGYTLFTLSIIAYISSSVNILSVLGGHYIAQYINSIESWFRINMAISLGIVFFIDFYFLGKDFYIDVFQELDKESNFMRWFLFFTSITFGIVGMVWCIKSGFWARSIMVRFLM